MISVIYKAIHKRLAADSKNFGGCELMNVCKGGLRNILVQDAGVTSNVLQLIWCFIAQLSLGNWSRIDA